MEALVRRKLEEGALDGVFVRPGHSRARIVPEQCPEGGGRGAPREPVPDRARRILPGIHDAGEAPVPRRGAWRKACALGERGRFGSEPEREKRFDEPPRAPGVDGAASVDQAAAQVRQHREPGFGILLREEVEPGGVRAGRQSVRALRGVVRSEVGGGPQVDVARRPAGGFGAVWHARPVRRGEVDQSGLGGAVEIDREALLESRGGRSGGQPVGRGGAHWRHARREAGRIRSCVRACSARRGSAKRWAVVRRHSGFRRGTEG
ncbi:MAG: hypothetical protein GVY27_09655 [Deinococcus-Thermus bacterium]|nr:hypothetical protein [Deinococcota bacterium]